LIPAIVRYAVGRYTLSHKGESGRELAMSALSKFDLVPVDAGISDSAVEIAHRHRLAMADALALCHRGKS